MYRKTWFIALLLLLLSIIGFVTHIKKAHGAKEYQTGAGSGFTYQGQLTQSGTPMDDNCDFRFSLWTEASTGTQVGESQVVLGVEVARGYFTIPNLDFGNNAFNGEERWLGIEVKCAGEIDYTALNPRQAVTPAPYALALPGLFTQQNGTSPNVIGGYPNNLVTEGVHGAVIGGGGTQNNENLVNDHYGTVSGGSGNQTGDGDATSDNSAFASVGGGENNTANSAYSTVGGGSGNLADGVGAFIGGGGYDGLQQEGNQASGSASTVGGGLGNSIPVTGTYATIDGGMDNVAGGIGATISGGQNNNAEGQNAAISGGSDNIAAGEGTAIGGGLNNSAQGRAAAVIGGESNSANGDYSTIAGGLGAEAILYGQTANASGFFSQSGDAQISTYVLRNLTTDTNAKELFLDGTSLRLTLPVNRTMVFELFIVARRDAHDRSAAYTFRGVIRNDNGSTSILGSPAKTVLGEDDTAWDVSIGASDTYDALIIQVTGAVDATIRWVAVVRTVEVAW